MHEKTFRLSNRTLCANKISYELLHIVFYHQNVYTFSRKFAFNKTDKLL